MYEVGNYSEKIKMDKIGMMRNRSRTIILVTIILIIIVVVVDEVDGNDEIKPIEPGCNGEMRGNMPQIVHIHPRARALCFYLYNTKMPSPECHLF